MLARLDVLADATVSCESLSLGEIAFASVAAACVERARITEVSFSPLVHSSVSGTAMEPRYYGADGSRLAFDAVVDSVIGADGVLHFGDKTSCRVAGGVVAGFAVYGAERGHLAHFGHLRSYADFVGVFGEPDDAEEVVTYGDLMGVRCWYAAARKLVYWDSGDERVSSVTVGFDGP